MADLSLRARTRSETGRHVHALRRQGEVPGVLYGHNREPLAISADAHALERIWHRAGRSHLIDLTVDDGKPVKVLIRDLQIEPRRASVLHADFFAVNLREKLTVDIPVLVTGESPVVARHEGQVQQTVTHLRVDCLPGDIPAQFTVDITGLEEIDAGIHIGDVELPHGVTLHQTVDPEELVVKIATVRVAAAEEEEAAAEGEAAEGEAEAAGEGETAEGGEGTEG